MSLGVWADGVGPLGAILFVDEGRGVAELQEDGCEGRTLCDGCLGLDTDFVAGGIDGFVEAGLAFVGDGAERAVLPDAEDLLAGAKVAGGGVVEGVELEGAGGVEVEAEGGETGLEGGWIGDGELQFDLCTLHGESIRLMDGVRAIRMERWLVEKRYV